ncbi:hypothetical protein AAUI01_08460 [Pseudomonas mosselii]|uniref:hypothetical protein n=1 Tax=Pseudomonas mosselii TaxID=78327 RepID=UPI0032E4459D
MSTKNSLMDFAKKAIEDYRPQNKQKLVADFMGFLSLNFPNHVDGFDSSDVASFLSSKEANGWIVISWDDPKSRWDSLLIAAENHGTAYGALLMIEVELIT